MSNPFREIEKDLVTLSQMVIDVSCALHEPKMAVYMERKEMAVYMERKVRRILKRYGVRKRRLPTFRATTN